MANGIRDKSIAEAHVQCKDEQATHTSTGAFRDEEFPCSVDASEVLVDVVLEQRGPVVDVLDNG
eukprot:3995210-Pleurochrysis_carterae.AAC.1